jgi:hypothetical protein
MPKSNANTPLMARIATEIEKAEMNQTFELSTGTKHWAVQGKSVPNHILSIVGGYI